MVVPAMLQSSLNLNTLVLALLSLLNFLFFTPACAWHGLVAGLISGSIYILAAMIISGNYSASCSQVVTL